MALIDVLKYDAGSDEEFAWKYPGNDRILGSQLIVNEGQQAIFVKGGQALDVFLPGTYTLATGNLPLINRLINLPFGGDTPFSAEVWFINTTVKRNLPWGTPSPIPLMDTKLGFPISARSFGRWGARIVDPLPFLTQILGSQIEADAQKIYEYFIGKLIQELSESISKILHSGEASILEIGTKLSQISQEALDAAKDEFKKFGIELISFDVESVNLPEEELGKIQNVFEKTLEAKELSKVQLEGAYAAIKSFEVMNTAAGNEGDNSLGSLVGAGLGLGAGLPVGQKIGQKIDIESGQSQKSSVERIRELKTLMAEGLISEDDFAKKRDEIISDI